MYSEGFWLTVGGMAAVLVAGNGVRHNALEESNSSYARTA